MIGLGQRYVRARFSVCPASASIVPAAGLLELGRRNSPAIVVAIIAVVAGTIALLLVPVSLLLPKHHRQHYYTGSRGSPPTTRPRSHALRHLVRLGFRALRR